MRCPGKRAFSTKKHRPPSQKKTKQKQTPPEDSPQISFGLVLVFALMLTPYLPQGRTPTPAKEGLLVGNGNLHKCPHPYRLPKLPCNRTSLPVRLSQYFCDMMTNVPSTDKPWCGSSKLTALSKQLRRILNLARASNKQKSMFALAMGHHLWLHFGVDEHNLCHLF